MHHIFVDENLISEEKILISKESDKENFDHLSKSLRINIGEYVLCSPVPYNMVFDYKCKVLSINEEMIELAIEGKTNANELPVKINLYQGLPKSDKLEFIIEKAVELGVYKIIPVEMTNSVSKINEKSDKKLDRYMKISKSAAEQSKRNIVPEVMTAIKYEQMLKELSGKDIMLFYENADGINATRKYIFDLKKSGAKEINIVVGPEGGFTEKEIEEAKTVGAKILSLGTRILRTETAALTALSILMYEIN